RVYGAAPVLRWWPEIRFPTLMIEPPVDDHGAWENGAPLILEVPYEDLASWGPAFLNVRGMGHSDELAAMNALELQHIPLIPERLLDELNRVTPSNEGLMLYRPCRVQLKDGTIDERVYVVEAESFVHLWGHWPQHSGMPEVLLSDIARI